jgi:hypothetical protein
LIVQKKTLLKFTIYSVKKKNKDKDKKEKTKEIYEGENLHFVLCASEENEEKRRRREEGRGGDGIFLVVTSRCLLFISRKKGSFVHAARVIHVCVFYCISKTNMLLPEYRVLYLTHLHGMKSRHIKS